VAATDRVMMPSHAPQRRQAAHLFIAVAGLVLWCVLGCSLPPEKSSSAPQKKPRLTNSLGMEFVYIPPGTFLMGSRWDEIGRYEDETLHQVVLTKGFYLQTTEVTQGQWKALSGDNPAEFSACGDDCPVEKVSWQDCKEFIQTLNEREAPGTYRLPTEAEWEYGCRAGTATPFFFGACLTTGQANYEGTNPLPGCLEGTSRGRTTPVKSFPPNVWGLYDMHGNVWEWCEDSCAWDTRTGVVTDTYVMGIVDPLSTKKELNRIIRGGSWLGDARVCRCAFRLFSAADRRDGNLGFRVAFSP
jgi:formylglycine-generating enzyme